MRKPSGIMETLQILIITVVVWLNTMNTHSTVLLEMANFTINYNNKSDFSLKEKKKKR